MEEYIVKLMNCFDNSFINQNLEFVAHKDANEYLRLEDCENELDVKCKVLEWFSRGACKTKPFGNRAKNNKFNWFMLNGINSYLGTKFTKVDMEQIYTYLGNRCNHKRIIRFIESGYDISVLKEVE